MKKLLLITILCLGINISMQSQSDSIYKKIDSLIVELYPETQVVIDSNTITCEIDMEVWRDQKNVDIKDLRTIVNHEHGINTLVENFISELRRAALKIGILGYLCELEFVRVIFKDNQEYKFKRHRSYRHYIL